MGCKCRSVLRWFKDALCAPELSALAERVLGRPVNKAKRKKTNLSVVSSVSISARFMTSKSRMETNGVERERVKSSVAGDLEQRAEIN